MAKRKSGKKATLPRAGDESIAAVGKRLAYVRNEFRNKSIANAAKIAEATPAEWRAWESGKTLIPRRNAWFIARRTDSNFPPQKSGEWSPSEWIYTGYSTTRRVPSLLPQIGSDLSGFASRICEAMASHDITLADVQKIDDSLVFCYADDIRAFAAGLDEPTIRQLKGLIDIFEVDAEWLYTVPGVKAKSFESKRWQLSFKPYFREGWDIAGGPALKSRVGSAFKAAGISPTDAKRLFKDIKDAGELTAIALLCGVPLESLIFDDQELMIMRRRIGRLKRRLGTTPPRKRRKSAA